MRQKREHRERWRQTQKDRDIDINEHRRGHGGRQAVRGRKDEIEKQRGTQR